jgi:hypothetical protein
VGGIVEGVAVRLLVTAIVHEVNAKAKRPTHRPRRDRLVGVSRLRRFMFGPNISGQMTSSIVGRA